MEIEELTKSQIVLLVLLVSFVTSIATGIVTVSLLAQAPPAVTQTVNRIVERTVETVVPVETEGQVASVITKETTVVVKEDDLITESIGTSFNKIVRVHSGAATTSPVVALGSLIGSGLVVTDSASVTEDHAVSREDTFFNYTVIQEIPEVGIAVLAPLDGEESLTGPTFSKIDTSALKLGQTLIGLYGAKSDRVSMTTLAATADLASVPVGEDAEVSVHAVETNISGTITSGAPLISIFGDLVGISTATSRADARGTFVAFGDIAALIATPEAPAEEEGSETSDTDAQ